jgi:starch phosphorylase
MAKIYDIYMEGWREDPGRLASAGDIPDDALQAARREARCHLRELTISAAGIDLDPELLTIGFARRFASYKRADLIFHDLDRLISICEGKAQFVFAGKAHPDDEDGKRLIESVFLAAKTLTGKVKVAFLPDYSMATGLAITSGVDVWLNNPVRPMEASGTSGMKASMNGVPNCSILDGWWPEACEHGVNGWAFGSENTERDDARDAAALYQVLEQEVVPLWLQGGSDWVAMMRAAIVTSANFTAARMLSEYQRIYASFNA